MSNGNIFRRQLGIYHQNIVGSKCPKSTIEQVELLLHKLVPDILIISEADTEVVTSWNYPGYTAHRGHLPGGHLVRVSAIVRNCLEHSVTHIEEQVPNVVVNFRLNNKQFRVTGVYREWNFSAVPTDRKDQEIRWTQFEDAWYKDNRRCKNSLLLGDMNFCYSCSCSPHQQSLETLRSSVMDNIVFRGWPQVITGNTRHQGKQVPSLLDHCYMNNPDTIKYTLNKAYGGSDHNTIGVVIKTSRFIPLNEEIISRCWERVNWHWGRYLVQYPAIMHRVFEYTDPNDQLDSIEVELRLIMDTIAPEQIIKIKPGSQRWMTTHISDLLEYRDGLKAVWIKSKCPADERKWKEARTEARFHVRRAKETQVLADLEVKDLKKRWKRIRVITGGESNSGPPTELLENGVLYKDEVDIANILNQGFGDKVSGIMNKVKADPDLAMRLFEDYAKMKESKRKFGTFEFREVTCKEVKAACRSLNNTSALGTDGIPTIMIKELHRELAPYLTFLVNTIFRTGIYPRRWREGIITPIHKSGPRNVKLNFRPVTILNSLSKVWEKLANNQITAYWMKYDIIDDCQHGYKEGRGTSTYWADLVAKICRAKDRSKKALLQVFDLSAAFNLCQVDILRPKLARVGFKEKSINLLCETMTKRQIKVKIGDKYSEVREVSTGTAEGGITSPGLFNFTLCDLAAIKIRVEAAAKAGIRTEQAMLAVEAGEKTLEDTKFDLIRAESVESEASGYADDSGILTSADTEEELRAAAFETDHQIMTFFEANGMSANRKKTEIISLANRFARPVTVGEVKSQAVIKLLGLKMSDKLSFMPQAQEVVRKVTAKLPSLIRLKAWASRDTLVSSAKSILLSHFEYLLEVYGGELRVQTLLQRCQNRIMRALLGKELLDKVPVSSMLAELGWDSVQNMVRYRTLCVIRKVDRHRAAPYMWRLLTTGANHGYNTRRWRLDVSFSSQSMATSNSLVHRGLALYDQLNLYTLGADMVEYKEIVHSKLISLFPNGNI